MQQPKPTETATREIMDPADAATHLESMTAGEPEPGQAPEPEPEAEAQPEGEETPEAEAAAPEGGKLPEHVQKAIDARIGKEIAKAREATEKATQLEQELKAAQEATQAAIASAVPLHPDYLTPEETALIRRANALETEAATLAENFEGIENEDPKKSLSAADVRKRYAEVMREMPVVSAKADEVYRRAKQQQLADMAEGAKVRKAREAAAAKAKASGKPAGTPGAEGGEAPTPASAGRPAVVPPAKTGQSAKRFQEAGGDRTAAVRELAELAGD